MPVHKLVTTPEEAFRAIRMRLEHDMEPVWQLTKQPRYVPYWLIVRELFPIAESIGFLVHGHKSTVKNLHDVLAKDLVKIRSDYANVNYIVADIYRHSLIHQDEMRSLRAGGLTIEWRLSIGDGSTHLQRYSKDTKHRTATLTFDMHAFYEDLIELLKLYEKSGPKKSVVKRYNDWTLKVDATKESQAQARDFYFKKEPVKESGD